MASTEDKLQQAQAHASAGRFAEAASLCETLLDQDSGNAAALQLCGVSYLYCNRIDDAVRLLKAATQAEPLDSSAWFDLGLAQQAAALPAEAAASYNHALALKPDHLHAWSRLSIIYKRLAKWDEAAEACRRAIELAPDEAELVCSLANIHLERQQWPEAVAVFRQALEKKPQYPEALNGLGQALKGNGQYDAAREAFVQALVQRPRFLEALFNLGVTLQALERWPDAVSAYKRALEIAPHSVDVLGNLGNSLRSAREFSAATIIHQKLVSLCPNHAPAYNSLGNSLLGLKRFADAKAAFDHALALHPDDPNTLCNLGNVHLAQNQLDLAIGFYRCALQIQPGFAQAVFNEGLVQLLKGDLREGLPKYELRWVLKRKACADQPPRGTWSGDTPVEGKTLLLCCEQGLGDTLQFIRYVALLNARGAKVILRVQAALKQLLSSLPGVTLVTAEEETLPAFDLYCLLLSLPLAFGTELSTIPAAFPYIQAPAAKVGYWREKLNRSPGLKIGIACSGNPQHRNDYNRSCPLDAFRPLAAATRCALYLLQKEVKPADATTLAQSQDFIDLSPKLHDFTDTAAVIANLDLVISVDTSVVHLAGALGKPVWTLLPFAPDWRWMLERNDSPWYPSMRLFRQPKPDDWTSVMARVAAELKGFHPKPGDVLNR